MEAFFPVERETGARDRRARIEVVDLVKAYHRKRVVDRVSLEVGSGEVVGLLGPNGAGKTTTFYMVIGLTQPDSGDVLLNGEPITALPMYQRARKGISYLTQEPSIFRRLTVQDNIMAILETLPLTVHERQLRLQELLEELGTSHLAKQRAYSLSGGERRRVEITRCLVSSPDFILLDEPFAGIDPLAVLDIQTIVSQLRGKGIGILITDHNVRETLEITDRAYIINEGTILESGPPAVIARSEKVKRFYLGEKFQL
ncbi:LPS export ABC transporter ATP-binding protein [bacterium]|nr:LPS export ABC transporter ATP-binding protein [candidate division CSSED10-310 bacterium]